MTSRFQLSSDPPTNLAYKLSVMAPCVGVYVGSCAQHCHHCVIPTKLPPLIHNAVEIVNNDNNTESSIKDIIIDKDRGGDWLGSYTNPYDWILLTKDNTNSVKIPHIGPIPYGP